MHEQKFSGLLLISGFDANYSYINKRLFFFSGSESLVFRLLVFVSVTEFQIRGDIEDNSEIIFLISQHFSTKTLCCDPSLELSQ